MLDLGPVPHDEEPEQLGPNYDPTKALDECRRYVKMLEKLFPPVGNARFVITSNPHDFGSYYSVEVKYDSDNENEEEFAYNVEANLPANWGT